MSRVSSLSARAIRQASAKSMGVSAYLRVSFCDFADLAAEVEGHFKGP